MRWFIVAATVLAGFAAVAYHNHLFGLSDDATDPAVDRQIAFRAAQDAAEQAAERSASAHQRSIGRRKAHPQSSRSSSSEVAVAAQSCNAPSASTDDPPIESDALFPPASIMACKDAVDFMHTAARTIQNANYSCDTISSLVPMIFRRGFTISCNHFSYTYEFQDNGGHWEVTINGRLIAERP